jgi:hypothetical protein
VGTAGLVPLLTRHLACDHQYAQDIRIRLHPYYNKQSDNKVVYYRFTQISQILQYSEPIPILFGRVVKGNILNAKSFLY